MHKHLVPSSDGVDRGLLLLIMAMCALAALAVVSLSYISYLDKQNATGPAEPPLTSAPNYMIYIDGIVIPADRVSIQGSVVTYDQNGRFAGIVSGTFRIKALNTVESTIHGTP